MKLIFKKRAVGHLKQIRAYIAKDSPAAATCVIERIEKVTSRLLLMPLSGRPGAVKGTRLLVIRGLPYIVVHRVRAGNVEIIAALHAARQRRS